MFLSSTFWDSTSTPLRFRDTSDTEEEKLSEKGEVRFFLNFKYFYLGVTADITFTSSLSGDYVWRTICCNSLLPYYGRADCTCFVSCTIAIILMVYVLHWTVFRYTYFNTFILCGLTLSRNFFESHPYSLFLT